MLHANWPILGGRPAQAKGAAVVEAGQPWRQWNGMALAAYGAVAAFVGATGLSGATITAAVKNELQKTDDDLWLGAAGAVAIDPVSPKAPNSHEQSLLETSTTQARGGRVRHLGN